MTERRRPYGDLEENGLIIRRSRQTGRKKVVLESALEAECLEAITSDPSLGLDLTFWMAAEERGLEVLENYSGLTGLHLSGEGALDLDINSMGSLESLSLEFFQCTVDLSCLPRLRHYIGDGNNLVVPDTGSNVEHLRLRNYKPASGDLSDLSSLKSLVNLELNFSKIQSLDGLPEHVARLSLHGASALVDISAVRNAAAAMRTLSIEKCRKIQSWLPLLSLAELTSLGLNGVGPIESIGFISELPKLERFGWSGSTVIENGDLAPCLEHPSLQRIWIDNKKHYSHKEAEINAVLEARHNSGGESDGSSRRRIEADAQQHDELGAIVYDGDGFAELSSELVQSSDVVFEVAVESDERLPTDDELDQFADAVKRRDELFGRTSEDVRSRAEEVFAGIFEEWLDDWDHLDPALRARLEGGETGAMIAAELTRVQRVTLEVHCDDDPTIAIECSIGDDEMTDVVVVTRFALDGTMEPATLEW